MLREMRVGGEKGGEFGFDDFGHFRREGGGGDREEEVSEAGGLGMQGR